MEKILFVHGAWHNGAAWDKVRAILKKKGYQTEAVTLEGNQPGNTSVTDFDAITASLRAAVEKEDRLILVGHSSAGQVIQSVAPELKDKISRIIFNNAWIIPDGKSQFDLIDPAVTGGMIAAAESGNNRTIPMDEGFLRGVLANSADAALQDELISLLVPQPLSQMVQKIDAVPFIEADFDVVLLYAKDDISVPDGVYLGMYKALGDDKPVVEIDGDHECLFTDPEGFAAGLEKCLLL